MATQKLYSTRAGPGVQRSQSLQHGIALVFGVLVLFAAGFLPTDAVHDARHVLAFPC